MYLDTTQTTVHTIFSTLSCSISLPSPQRTLRSHHSMIWGIPFGPSRRGNLVQLVSGCRSVVRSAHVDSPYTTHLWAVLVCLVLVPGRDFLVVPPATVVSSRVSLSLTSSTLPTPDPELCLVPHRYSSWNRKWILSSFRQPRKVYVFTVLGRHLPFVISRPFLPWTLFSFFRHMGLFSLPPNFGWPSTAPLLSTTTTPK